MTEKWKLTFIQYFWYLLGYSKNWYYKSDLEERMRYSKKLEKKEE